MTYLVDPRTGPRGWPGGHRDDQAQDSCSDRHVQAHHCQQQGRRLAQGEGVVL